MNGLTSDLYCAAHLSDDRGTVRRGPALVSGTTMKSQCAEEPTTPAVQSVCDVVSVKGSHCDFCGANRAWWRYKTSGGRWLACEPCHALIERGDAHSLARRGADCYGRRHKLAGKWSVAGVAAIANLQAGFWQGRYGPAHGVARRYIRNRATGTTAWGLYDREPTGSRA
jgi:hypothetical protein